MSKRIPITPQITAAIRKGVGDDGLDPSNFAVYETRMLSTEPLRKSGFFNKAEVSQSTLAAMTDLLNTPGSAIPLQLMHDTSVTPSGRVFAAQQGLTPSGAAEVRGLFYVPGDKQDLIADIDNSVINEVSVGIKTDKALCSECGFDYYGPDASISNLLSLTCADGHTIGQDGVHLNLVGLDKFMELSLVGNGAAKNPKIMPRAMQTMGKDFTDRLAASHLPGEALFLQASYKLDEGKTKQTTGDSKMPNDELVTALAASATKVGTLEASIVTKDGAIATLNTELTALKASLEDERKKVTDLTAASKDAPAVLARAETAEKKLKDAAEKLKPHLVAAMAADGDTTAIPEDFEAQLSLVESKGIKLHQAIGAKTDGTKKVDATGDAETARKANFKLS